LAPVARTDPSPVPAPLGYPNFVSLVTAIRPTDAVALSAAVAVAISAAVG